MKKVTFIRYAMTMLIAFIISGSNIHTANAAIDPTLDRTRVISTLTHFHNNIPIFYAVDRLEAKIMSGPNLHGTYGMLTPPGTSGVSVLQFLQDIRNRTVSICQYIKISRGLASLEIVYITEHDYSAAPSIPQVMIIPTSMY
ncbi:MAG: hypothetical protein ACK502_04845, partial [Alphaproteobacteria bacterium]